MRERIEQMQMDGSLEELVEKLIERMQQEDFISVDEPFDRSRQSHHAETKPAKRKVR